MDMQHYVILEMMANHTVNASMALLGALAKFVRQRMVENDGCVVRMDSAYLVHVWDLHLRVFIQKKLMITPNYVPSEMEVFVKNVGPTGAVNTAIDVPR